MIPSLCGACHEPLPQFRFFRVRCPACGAMHRSVRADLPWYVAICQGILPFVAFFGVLFLPFGLVVNVFVSFGALFAIAVFTSLLFQTWRPMAANASAERSSNAV